MVKYTYQTLARARRAVRQRLRDGWEIYVQRRLTREPEYDEVWARLDGNVITTEPITPPEGIVLDSVLREVDRTST